MNIKDLYEAEQLVLTIRNEQELFIAKLSALKAVRLSSINVFQQYRLRRDIDWATRDVVNIPTALRSAEEHYMSIRGIQVMPF